MATYDGSVKYKVDMDTKDAKQSLSSFSTSLKTVGDKAGEIGKTMTTKVTAPIAAGATAAVAGFMKISAELDEIGKTAAGVNSTAEGLQALQFAGKMAGIESDKMADILKKVQELTTNNAEAFEEAGINITDMNDEMLSSDTIFQNLISGLSDLSTEERNATLLALGFTEELTSINKAMEDTEAFAGNVEKGLENAVSDESIQKFEEFNDKVEALKTEFGLAGVELAEQLLPYLDDLADWLAEGGMDAIVDFIKQVADFTEENWQLIAALAALGPALQIFSGLTTFATNVANLANKLKGLTTAAETAQTVLGGGTTATTTATTGAGLSGLGVAGAGLGIAAGTVGTIALADAAAAYNIEKYGEGGSGQYGLSAADRAAMMSEADAGIYGNTSGYADIYGGGTGGGVTIDSVEVNTTTELSPENQGQLVDEIMTEVGKELTRTQVFAK